MTMKKSALASLFAMLAMAAAAHAQNTPRINHVLPTGGRQGTTFDFSVVGQELTDVVGLHFNFPGVKVESGTSEATPPDKGKMVKGKKGAPQGLITQRFKVTLPATAPLGIQDVRIITKQGISNPRAFVVGDLKDLLEKEPNNDLPQAQKIELNSTVNGVITTPTDVDYYAFTGKKGQRVVLACLASSIDSKLPAMIQLYGVGDVYLGSNRGYNNTDAVLDAVLPADGEYYVRVFSFSYTLGGTDYFYRLSVSTAPWIDAVFPPVIEPGKAAEVTVYGRNLPGGKLDPTAMLDERALEKATLTVKAPGDPRATQRLAHAGIVTPPASMLDGFDQYLKNPVGQSNPYLITYAPAPVVIDSPDNDQQDKAQKINVPCVIAGRIEKKGDKDWYSFTVKKGQVLNIEAFSDRLGAPVELLFQVRDSQNNLVTDQKESLEILSPQFYSRTEDPLRYRFVAPADGTYQLAVTSRDAFTLFGPKHIYTVRIVEEEPDFRLIAMPTSVLAPEANTLNQAGGTAFNVYVWRMAGFNAEISLAGEKLPPGIIVRPQTISGIQKQAVVVVHAEPGAKPYDGPITLVGTATVNGKKLVREVRSATISWPVAQANIPTITRLDRELVVAVRGPAAYTLAVGSEPIKVNQGQPVSIPVKLVPGADFKTTVQVVALGGPPGLIPKVVSLTPGQGGNVTLDTKGGAQIPPGNYTVVLRGQTQPINPKQPPKGPQPVNIVQVSMPVTVTIVPKQLGKFNATPANVKVAAGKSTEVSVRLARQYDLPLALKVEAIIPPNAKGVTVKGATIPADGEDAKLVFAVAPGTPAGQQVSITIRATAMFNGTIPVVHETKFSLSVAK